jgi:hypothetical protein
MIVFGLPSPVSGILTLHYPPPGIPRHRHLARGGWLIESAITEPAVTLALRTNRPFCNAG